MIKSDNATLNLVILLIPGFIALFVISLIVDIGGLKEFDIVFYGFMLTTVCWALSYPILWIFTKLSGKIIVWKPTTPVFTSYMTILSVVLGILIGIGIQNDWFYAALRAIPGTDVINKRSFKRPMPFLLFQNSTGKLRRDGDGRPGTGVKVTEAWVRVKLKQGGGTYDGWPEFYSSGSDPSELYLSPACQVQNPGESTEKVAKHKGPGVLIYEREILSVEFLDRPESACFLQWFPSK
jgi:hypothetical protein